MHAALIAECSKPLDRMINGHLSEAKQGSATLEDVDEGTFIRFIRWAYNKDYPAPEHTLVDSDSESRSAPKTPKDAWGINDDDEHWGVWSTKKGKKKKDTAHATLSKGFLRESFITQYEPSDWGNVADAYVNDARGNRIPEEDYSEVFLGHARMYVFAEKYDIQALKRLALRKLHNTLSIFTLYRERVGDITTLLKYVYANTAETVEGTKDIRTMLAQYIGCEMEMLIAYGEIKDLMLDNGDILGDFLKMFAVEVS